LKIKSQENPDNNLESYSTLKNTWHLGSQMNSLICSDKTRDSLFKPALFRSKKSTTSESSIDE
jgi:hypothetical protein